MERISGKTGTACFSEAPSIPQRRAASGKRRLCPAGPGSGDPRGPPRICAPGPPLRPEAVFVVRNDGLSVRTFPPLVTSLLGKHVKNTTTRKHPRARACLTTRTFSLRVTSFCPPGFLSPVVQRRLSERVPLGSESLLCPGASPLFPAFVLFPPTALLNKLQ